MDDAMFLKLVVESATGKKLTYRDSFMTSDGERWFYETIYGGVVYKVVAVRDTGKILCYVNHPVRQPEPTFVDKLMSRESAAAERIQQSYRHAMSDPGYKMCRERLGREFAEMQ